MDLKKKASMLQGWCVASGGSTSPWTSKGHHLLPGGQEMTVTVSPPGSTGRVKRGIRGRNSSPPRWWGEAVISQGHLHWSRSFKWGFNTEGHGSVSRGLRKRFIPIINLIYMEDGSHTGKYILNVLRLNLVKEVRETISSLKAGNRIQISHSF